MFLNVITLIENSVIMSFKYKLFKEIFRMSSAAAQKASTRSPLHQLSCFDLRRSEARADVSDGVTN